MMIMRLQPTMLKGLTSKHPKWSNNKSMPREIQGTYISIQYIHIHTYSTEQIYHLRRVQASAAESLFLGSTTNRRWTKSCAHICQRCWEIWEIWGTRHASFRGWFFVPCISFVLFVFPHISHTSWFTLIASYFIILILQTLNCFNRVATQRPDSLAVFRSFAPNGLAIRRLSAMQLWPTSLSVNFNEHIRIKEAFCISKYIYILCSWL